MGDPERDEFARGLGVGKTTLASYERGETEPTASVLNAYREKYGANLIWFVTGKGEAVEANQRVQPADLPAEFIRLPQYDVAASAGRGVISYVEHAANEVTFEKRFLRALGAQPESCFLMWAKGDSMLPTFPDGAMLIVDQSQQTVDDGRIYVFNAEGNLLVKRARWRFDGSLDLMSDNVAGNYPVESFVTDRIVDLIVVGRVVWYGRSA
ncbi:Phage repressor protein C, contains Cro/C1-type HTH and peptisase s24 domains [Rhizobium sp. 9140]|nr:Phage repressor protein C, contains Cro/C1-type HTH and peptisase s24 domains [Rhizobium sp. 9140]